MDLGKLPEHVCKSVTDAFIYDGFSGFRARFGWGYIIEAMINPAYSATVLFRLQQYFFLKYSVLAKRSGRTVINRFFAGYYKWLSLIAARVNFILNAGFEVSSSADIRPGLIIHHPQGVIIGGDTRIGTGVHLFKNVLLGEKEGCYPTIRDKAVLYANSVVIGGVTVHDNAVIAPNSVVIHDVEKDTVVAGVPAGPIKKEGSL